MTEQGIYRDIAERTGGDIYIGVVGPVRTGKSTFIRKFMEGCVLPRIADEYDKARTVDGMPQAASGRTVMTAEPKFIPDESVRIHIGDTVMNVKMIDCVGYLIPEALGQNENGAPRMVNTPWSETPIPFAEAAETGTRKVICEHATIGMVVTTDGTIGEIPRESYLEAEERVISELRGLGKPFAIILNSARPASKEARELALSLEEKYKTPVALVNCLELDEDDIHHILELLLDEFPVTELTFRVPKWLSVPARNHPLRESVFAEISDMTEGIAKMGDVGRVLAFVNGREPGRTYTVTELNAGDGKGEISLKLPEELFFAVTEDLSGLSVPDDAALLSLICDLAKAKKAYGKVEQALSDVGESGYGIVMPDMEALRLEEPRLTKQPGGYGVKLRASAESIHMIRANIETEINPVIGTEEQAKDMVAYLKGEFEENPARIWDFNMFGKSLYEMLSEGIKAKMQNMPEESRAKMSETLERIINEGSGGLICILL
ncbi:MAG: stage IV sporulation protein A [Eubacteriales bacterium]